MLFLERLLPRVCKTSHSLQVLHFDDNYVGTDLKVEIAQKLGIERIEGDHDDYRHTAFAQNYLKKEQASILKFIKKNTIDHLVETDESAI